MIKRANWFEAKVADMKNAVAFYRDILDLKVRREWPNYLIFDLPETLTFSVILGGKKGERRVTKHIFCG